MTQQDPKKHGINEIPWEEGHNEFSKQANERGKIFEDKHWSALKNALWINKENQENLWVFHKISFNYSSIEWNIPENDKISQAINKTFQNEDEIRKLGLKMTKEEIEKIITLLQASLTKKEDEKKNPPETKEKQEEREIKENPFSPIINKIILEEKEKKGEKAKPEITEEEWLEIKKALNSKMNWWKRATYNKDFFEEALSNLFSITDTKKDYIINVLFRCEDENKKVENRGNFKKNHWWELIPDWKNDFEKGSILEDTYNILWGNYFIAKDKLENKDEQEKSLNLAFEKSLNEVIYGKQIERNESFDLKVKIINNPVKPIKERFKELNNINEEVNKQEGIKSISKILTKWGERAKETIECEKLFNEILKIVQEWINQKKITEDKGDKILEKSREGLNKGDYEKLKEIKEGLNLEIWKLDKFWEKPKT